MGCTSTCSEWGWRNIKKDSQKNATCGPSAEEVVDSQLDKGWWGWQGKGTSRALQESSVCTDTKTSKRNIRGRKHRPDVDMK